MEITLTVNDVGLDKSFVAGQKYLITKVQDVIEFYVEIKDIDGRPHWVDSVHPAVVDTVMEKLHKL